MKRLQHTVRPIVLTSLGCVALYGTVLGADVPPAPAPTSSATSSTDDTKIDSLIRQLGDADFRKRDAAADALKEFGPEALPALKKARESATDPEVASRADGIIQNVERPRVPGRLPGSAAAARAGRGRNLETVRTTVENGVRRIEVKEPGRNIRIEEGPNGVAMEVTGQEDGKEVVRNFQARTADQLKQQNPEAYALYEKCSGRGAGVIRMREGEVRGKLTFRRVPGGELLPLHRPGQIAENDDMREMRELLRRQLDAAAPKIAPDDQLDEMRGVLEEIRRQLDVDIEGIQPERVDPQAKPEPAK